MHLRCCTRLPFLLALVALVATGPLALTASAQSPYPSRPVKLVVGYAPASGADVVARLIANRLTDSLKQPFVVENKPGAGGAIAAQEFVRAPADGHTLMLAAMPQMIINFAATPKPRFDPMRDFAPVAQIVSVDLVLAINPQKVPAATLKEFIAWSQKQPVTFFGTPGPGTVGHFLAVMFGDTAKTKVEPVHFKATNDSLTALLGGDIHALFVPYTVAAAQIKAGKLRALAVTGRARAPMFPDTPTVKDAGYPDLEAGSWYGVFAPASTPQDILDKLSAEVVQAAQSPDTKAKFEDAGMSVTALNRAEFARAMKGDLTRWGQVVKATGFTTQE